MSANGCPKDHLTWFVIDAVGVMNTSAFYAAYREDGHGRAAYEPSMMIALLLYCWARGLRSSRLIERACVEDVACRVIAAHQRPDHATKARFVERHERALGELFGEVLTLCAYNAQAVCNERHLIVGAEVMTASPDFGHLAPMLTAARRELAAAGVIGPPGVVVADAGY